MFRCRAFVSPGRSPTGAPLVLSMASAWIAARFRRAGGALITGVVTISVLFMAIIGVRRAGYRSGKKEERTQAEIEQLERAVKDGENHAEITEAMHSANVNGPRTRDDVLKRLRQADD